MSRPLAARRAILEACEPRRLMTAINSGQRVDSSIGVSGEIDVYTIDVSASRPILIVNVATTSTSGSFKAGIDVRDSSGKSIDATASDNGIYFFDATRGGTYSIRVGAAKGSTGNYRLSTFTPNGTQADDDSDDFSDSRDDTDIDSGRRYGSDDGARRPRRVSDQREEESGDRRDGRPQRRGRERRPRDHDHRARRLDRVARNLTRRLPREAERRLLRDRQRRGQRRDGRVRRLVQPRAGPAIHGRSGHRRARQRRDARRRSARGRHRRLHDRGRRRRDDQRVAERHEPVDRRLRPRSSSSTAPTARPSRTSRARRAA